jgi:hypothetical protein
MLPTFVSQVRPKQQKDADNLALKALYNAVLKEQKSNPELALKKVAEQFPLTGHITNFTLTYADDTLVSTNKPAPISATMSGRLFFIPISALTQKTVRSASRWSILITTVNAI